MVAGWSGARGKTRNQEKTREVVKWLAMFDYSDRASLARMFGAVPRGQGAFFKSLEESKLVIVTKAPGLGITVYGLSDSGFKLAKLLLPHKQLTWRRTPSWSILAHTLTIQKIILDRKAELSGFSPERDLDLKAARANHLPDALLHYPDGRVVALEVELNHKATARIYNIYLSHLKNIQRDIYSEVLYVFPNAQLMKLYQDKHDEVIWPVYVKNERGRLELKSHLEGFGAVDVHTAGYFKFITDTVIEL